MIETSITINLTLSMAHTNWYDNISVAAGPGAGYLWGTERRRDIDPEEFIYSFIHPSIHSFVRLFVFITVHDAIAIFMIETSLTINKWLTWH